MKILTLSDWQALATKDPEDWRRLICRKIDACIEHTNTSVISASFAENCQLDQGPLAGVAYAVKDLFNVAGWPTHNSSIFPELLDHAAETSADIVLRMNELGATCVAKTQMNEFAYGLSGENPHYGDCAHPHLQGCLSGGSSSGSAHTVAAGYLPLAFGTDTGGSIRLPAAWCGIYGVRWSPDYFMGGGFPLAPSFDTMGWFTKTGGAMRVMLEAWFGESFGVGESSAIRGQYFLPEDQILPETCEAMNRRFQDLGLQEIERAVELRALLPKCQRSFNILQSREAYGIHEKWLDKYAALYDPQVRARILRARDWTQKDIEQACETSERVRFWFASYFQDHDFLAMPICPGPSVPSGEAKPELREQTLRLTTPASLAGLPALSVPVWLDAQRSVGIQFIFKEASPRVPLAILDLCENI